ncbi:uncharacterized protein LOC141709984 [Apium graveolens]|uniref:uncharacterized protein LOC141709984 n=1 Tax=Apium graveolens TaxID=4045 RepID=UPI003D7BE7D8
MIRTDNRTKFFQEYCHTLFASKGIIHQKSVPHNPQQNGKIEKTHRHLLETARALRLHANLRIKFWGDCVLSATYLINLMPSSVLSWKSPYQILLQQYPDYSRLKVLGCLCYSTNKTSDKLASRAFRCVFIGYPYAQKAYKLYDLDNHKVIISRDVTFQENIFPFKQSSISPVVSPSVQLDFSTESSDIPSFSMNHNVDNNVTDNTVDDDSLNQIFESSDAYIQSDNIISDYIASSSIVSLRKSSRSIQIPEKYTDYVLSNTSKAFCSQAFNVFADTQLTSFSTAYLATLAKVLSIHEPTSYAQAQLDQNWVDAMQTYLALGSIAS